MSEVAERPIYTAVLEHIQAVSPRLLPGQCLAAFHKPTRRERFFQSLEAAAEFFDTVAHQHSWYLAVASFSSERRTQNTVAQLQGLWLDLDAGPEKHKRDPCNTYATQRDALAALIAFAQATRLAPTRIVDSGAGLHVHFRLSEPAEPAVWMPLARALGRLCKAQGLRVDPACTTDSARLLRPTGALHANGNRVKLLKDTGRVWSVAELAALVAPVQPESVAPVLTAPSRVRLDVNADLPQWEPVPCSAAKAATKCAALREVADKRGDVPEPLWRAMLGIVKFSTEGEELAHAWSDGYAGYDFDETQEKFDRYEGTGPTLCESFAHLSDHCEACEHNGKIKTPLTLGRQSEPTPRLPTLETVEAPVSDSSEATDAAEDETAHATDLGLAKVHVRWHRERFKFDHGARCWVNYSGGAWVRCRKGEEQEAFKKISARLMEEAGKAQAASNSDKAKTFIACALRAQSAHGIASALKLATSDPAFAVSTEDFDCDPDLLNVLNGVVHLPTGELRDHDPALMLSRQCEVPYARGSDAPTWLRFLAEVTSDDADLIDYLQRACGYTLSGHTSAEKLFFMLGIGANGKSVFANVFRRILGSYAVVVPSAFLMLSQRDGGGATPELAMIAGARLVLANEVEAGATLSGQMVKVAVSTEAITARALYAAPTTFQPTHKLWVRGNHKPIIRDNDEGIWRRLDLIPFERNFAPHERDEGLEAKLMAEAPGILAWMVEGFRKWRRDGLRPARRVEAASLAYRNESDLMQQWVAERCSVGAALSVAQRQAYGSYRSWCDEQGLRPLTKRSFTRGLVERGYGEKREGGGTRQELYTGLALDR